MTHQIVRIAKGKKEVISYGSYGQLTNRLKQLRGSTKGGKVCGRHGRKYPVRYEILKIGLIHEND